MFKVRVESVLDKPVEAVFAALTDHANYKRFPGIDDSRLIEPGKTEKNGEGALREIVAGAFKLTERITHCTKPSRINYRIETATPLPLRHDQGEIIIEAVGDQTRVLWISEGHMDVPVVGNLLDPVVGRKISQLFTATLEHIGQN